MYKKISESISDKVGLDLIEVSTIVDVPTVVKNLKEVSKDNAALDYEFARNNMYQLLNKSMGAVEGVIQLMKEAESPRAIEAASAFIKCVSELNKDLVLLGSTTSKKPTEKENNVGIPTTVNNAIFVGSSDQLSDIIRDKMRSLNS